jgi:hypothetical protein
MTAARQERKSRRIRTVGAALLRAALASAAAGVAVFPASVPGSEYVVVNRHTGLAIDGFDPVAYFEVGRADLELHHAGAVWRFRNEGNRAAFAANPEVYMPRFGGHDPIAAARGAGTPGHPRLWLVASGGLYLFYSAEARAAFAANPDRAIDSAIRHWPEVERTLTR